MSLLGGSLGPFSAYLQTRSLDSAPPRSNSLEALPKVGRLDDAQIVRLADVLYILDGVQ